MSNSAAVSATAGFRVWVDYTACVDRTRCRREQQCCPAPIRGFLRPVTNVKNQESWRTCVKPHFTYCLCAYRCLGQQRSSSTSSGLWPITRWCLSCGQGPSAPAVLHRVDFGRSLLFFPSRVQPIAAIRTYHAGIVVSPTPFGAVTGIKMVLGDTSASCKERLDAEHVGGRQI